MYDQHTHIMYRFHSSMVEHSHFTRGGLGSIPGRCSSIFGIWREVLGCNVYIISQYSSSTPPKTTAIFRDFKKSTAMCKVHNVGLRYIKVLAPSKCPSKWLIKLLSHKKNYVPQFLKQRDINSYYVPNSIKKALYRHSAGRWHTFQIIHLIETTVLYILPDIWDDGKNRRTFINPFKLRTLPSDIWSVGKAPIAMLELTTWHASFTDFIKLRRYTDIGKQLLISNNRHRVRWEVLGLS